MSQYDIGMRGLMIWVLLLGGVSLLGCKKKGHTAETPSKAASQAKAAADENNTWYDAAGELLPSSMQFAGVALPRGTSEFRQEDGMRVYVSPVPIAKVQRYFSRRIHTAHIERVGSEGHLYRAAVLATELRSDQKFDLSILPSSRLGTRIEVRQLLSAKANALLHSPAARERALQELQRLD